MSDRTEWHKLLGLVLSPLFEQLGYETRLEVDLSLKSHFIDIVVIRRVEVKDFNQVIDRVYWEAFDDLNEHNLISFKSYSESFGSFEAEELLGHLINYCKQYDVSRKDVNLYAIVHHYPEQFLKPFIKTGFYKKIKGEEITDLDLEGFKRIRFIKTRTTNNPVLGLFSGDPVRIKKSYEFLKAEGNLISEVSSYLKKIGKYIGEVIEMYTKEDFFKEFPPDESPFVFPWEEEYHNKEIEAIKQRVEQEKQRAEQEKHRAEQEKQRAEQERQSIEQERQSIEQERQRAERIEQEKRKAEELLNEYRRRYGEL